MKESVGVFEAALEISERRAKSLRQIRDLYLAGKDEEATTLTKKFLGISEAGAQKRKKMPGPEKTMTEPGRPQKAKK